MTGDARALDGRVALVTGASRGIGRAAARGFGAAGAQIVALARTQGGLEELDDEIRSAGGPPAVLVPLDIRDFDALDRLGASLHERFGRLDVLLANAGQLGHLAPLGHIEPKVFDEVIAVNVTANWRLVRSLDPLLRRSEAGRALFVSSSLGSKARPFWGAYAVSKAALEALARTYRLETESSAVKVAIVDPGPMRTRMRAAAMPGEDPALLPQPDELAPFLVEMAAAGFVPPASVYRFRERSWSDAPAA